MARKKSRVAFIAAADLMACFVAIMFVVLDARKAEVEAEVQDLVEQRQEIISGLQAELKEILEQHEQGLKDAFRDWDTVVTTLSREGVPKSEYNLYLRVDGIYTDSSNQTLSDAELRVWLKKHQEGWQTETLILWLENGTNDQYIRVRDMVYSMPNPDGQGTKTISVTLPSGVKAGR